MQAQGIEIVETRIAAHIGQRTDLLGFRFADGTERYFDGFLVDEGLIPNTRYLDGWDVLTDDEGLLIVNDDRQVLTSAGEPVPGLFAAGGHCVGRAQSHRHGLCARPRRRPVGHRQPA